MPTFAIPFDENREIDKFIEKPALPKDLNSFSLFWHGVQNLIYKFIEKTEIGSTSKYREKESRALIPFL